PMEAERHTQISRTKTGVLLLLIGTLIGWLPVIGIVGAILIFVGAILVILGRKAFGAAHSRNVFLSILLFIVGIVIGAVAVISQAVGTFVAAMFPGGTYNPAQATLAVADFSARVQALGYLSVIPALINAAAYYLVWNRINKGEIPAPSGSAPMAAPPMPPR